MIGVNIAFATEFVSFWDLFGGHVGPEAGPVEQKMRCQRTYQKMKAMMDAF